MTAPLIESTLRERLLKILALARAGVGGEAENAEIVLGKLLRKHGLTLEDLEGSNEPRERVFFPTKDARARELFHQVVHRLFGAERSVWSRPNEYQRRAVDVTASEAAALTVAWDVYRTAYDEAEHELFLAFVIKHRLYDESTMGKHDRGDEVPTPEDRARTARLAAMVTTGLGHVESPMKRLAGVPWRDGK